MKKNTAWNTHNWLVHTIIWQHLSAVIPKFAKGRLLDIGCADKPYELLTKNKVEEYVGLDHADSQHSLSRADVIADAHNTNLEDSSFDTILSTSVLEHLEHPPEAICEMHRILKPGGHVILTCPLFWHLHEEPHDFFRFTKHGLRFMFTEAGLDIVILQPLSGFVVTFTQELLYFLNQFKRYRVLIFILNVLQWWLQKAAYSINKYDKSHQFTWLYLIVGRKSESN